LLGTRLDFSLNGNSSYSEISGPACIYLEIHEFTDQKRIFYDPQWFRLLSHSIERNREKLEIGTLNLHTHLKADAETMSYLLDSGHPEHEHSSAWLARWYLDTNNQNHTLERYDKDHHYSLPEILCKDAYLIAELAAVLSLFAMAAPRDPKLTPRYLCPVWTTRLLWPVGFLRNCTRMAQFSYVQVGLSWVIMP
jgi:hypothetical protein